MQLTKILKQIIMGTVLPFFTKTSELDEEFISLEKARMYIRGRGGNIITRESLLNKIYRGEFPSGTLLKSPFSGNYFFSKRYLMGLPILNAA